MTIHVTPIPKLTEYATPNVTIGSTAAPGSANTSIRSDSTIAGVALITSVNDTIARYNGTGGQLQGYTSGGPTVSDTGVMSLTAQPMVLTTVTSAINNVTGGGATYTIVFDGEITDQGGNMTTTTFTAPVAGNYLFNTQIMLLGLTAAMNDCRLVVDTDNRDYGGRLVNIGAVRDSNNQASITTSVIADMDASDTATVTLRIAGDANTADINGGSAALTWLSIGLLA